MSATVVNMAPIKFQWIGISRDEPSSKLYRIRPCLPCRAAKTGCSRDSPTCGACLRRRRPSLCIYEHQSPINETGTTVKKGIPNTQTNTKSTPREKSFADIAQHVKDGPGPPQTMAEELCIDAGHSTKLHDVQISQPLSPEENEDSTTSTAMRLEGNDEGMTLYEFHSPRMSQARQPIKPFSESQLQVLLPRSYTIQIPKTDYCEPTETNRTLYQLLLVLNYLFIVVMLPGDEGSLHQIIRRDEVDWDRSFVPQYGNLTWWLTAARRALTESNYLLAVSVEDLEQQIQYLLFALSQHTSPPSTFLSFNYLQSRPPYRPFGTMASVALICYAFMGINSCEMNGYDRKEIWALDHVTLETMVLRLNDSPLFSAQVTLSQVRSLIVGLQRAFQLEEIRVASTKPQILHLDQDSQIENYYRSAFSALDPELLPRLSFMMSRRVTPPNVTMEDSLAALAKFFSESDSVKDLEAAFTQVPEIWASISDRLIVTEMFHVKAWHDVYSRRPCEIQSQIRVFYVSL